MGHLTSAVWKQPTDPCLHAQLSDVSYSCVMSGSRTLNGDDDGDGHLALVHRFVTKQTHSMLFMLTGQESSNPMMSDDYSSDDLTLGDFS